jgi:CubicO group peptidase (beta-lactamase class C family)
MTCISYLKRIIIFLLGIAPLLCSPVISQESFKDVEKYIVNQVIENKIPGIACCVVKEDRMIWSGAYGWANIEKGVPMSIDGIMNIASISKTFTATAVMQLWEKELIQLDSDINLYLPFPVRNPHHPETPITVFHLLTHTSSIVDGDYYDASYSDGDPLISLQDWIKGYLVPGGQFYNEKQNFIHAEPGSLHEYSNVGYGLLGYLVEELSGMPFNEYCRIHIQEPLGMTESGWFIQEIDTTNHITPYEFTDDQNQPLELYSFPNYPDGLLRTSVRELSLYLMAIMNGGKYSKSRILEKSTLKMMLQPAVEMDQGQGLCWHKIKFEGLWGHSGGDPGVATFMFFNPRTKTGIITFQNNHNGDLFSVIRKLYAVADNL